MKKRPVYQINTDDLTIIKEWDSVSTAATEMRFPQPAICAAAAGKRISANGFYWCFVDTYDSETWHPKQRKTKEVLCVETGEIFDSAKQAAEKSGIEITAIRKSCTDPLGQIVAGKFHWKYV